MKYRQTLTGRRRSGGHSGRAQPGRTRHPGGRSGFRAAFTAAYGDLAATTRARHLAALRSALRWWREVGWLAGDPTRGCWPDERGGRCSSPTAPHSRRGQPGPVPGHRTGPAVLLPRRRALRTRPRPLAEREHGWTLHQLRHSALTHDAETWHLNRRSGTDLPSIAHEINPQTRGWIGCYGAFCRSELHFLARRIDDHLLRWAMQKFKRLRSRPAKARAWLDAIRRRHPRLSAH